MFDFSGFWSERFGSSGFHLYCPCKLPAWGGQSAKAKKLGSRASGTPLWAFLLLGLVSFYCWGLLGAGLFLLLGAGEFYYCCGLVGIITAVGRWVFTAGAGGSLLLWAGGFLVLWATGFLLLWAGGFLLLWAAGFLLLWAGGFNCWAWWFFTARG